MSNGAVWYPDASRWSPPLRAVAGRAHYCADDPEPAESARLVRVNGLMQRRPRSRAKAGRSLTRGRAAGPMPRLRDRVVALLGGGHSLTASEIAALLRLRGCGALRSVLTDYVAGGWVERERGVYPYRYRIGRRGRAALAQ